ncbi:MAG: hypothetical protein ACLT94_00275 [Lachnospira eligens]
MEEKKLPRENYLDNEHMFANKRERGFPQWKKGDVLRMMAKICSPFPARAKPAS